MTRNWSGGRYGRGSGFVKLSDIAEAAGCCKGIRVRHQTREVGAACVSRWATLATLVKVEILELST
jgi:hypothetical protein